MTKNLLVPWLMLAGLLAACGSAPPPVPATVTAVSNAMSGGMQAYAADHYAEARVFFGRALAEYQANDNRQGQVEALLDLADSALQQGDVTAARDYLSTARGIAVEDRLALLPRIGLYDAYADLQSQNANGAASVLDALLNDAATPLDVKQAALFARTQAAFDLKAADAGTWLAKLSAGNDPRGQARLQRLQALAARATGDDNEAISLYTRALAAYQSAYYRPGIAATHEEWADVLLAKQDWANARIHLRRALNVRLSMYDASHSARILDNLQKADTALGDAAAAKQDKEWADYLRNGGDPSVAPQPKQSPPP